MPANTTPIFTITPKMSWTATNPLGLLAVTGTASGAFDGTNSNVTLIYTAGSNGAFAQKVILESGGTNSTASVARLWINNGTANTAASANSLIMQYALPATTVSTTTATAHIEIPLMYQIPAGYRIYMAISSSSNLGAGWYCTIVAGDY